jgi:hypothetical protein
LQGKVALASQSRPVGLKAIAQPLKRLRARPHVCLIAWSVQHQVSYLYQELEASLGGGAKLPGHCATFWNRWIASRLLKASSKKNSDCRTLALIDNPFMITLAGFRLAIHSIVWPVVAILPMAEAHGVELVREGKPVATIVVPAKPLEVESYAAQEFQYHIEASTGARLPILHEDTDSATGPKLYLGATRAAATAGLDASPLLGNGYEIKTVGDSLILAGKDSVGDPLAADTHEGTLFGVYELLERELGVRWLWPGKLGEVIPQRRNLSLAPADTTVTPLLWFKHWRSGKSRGELVWLKRQRFGRSIQPQYGHSFGQYWPRFGQAHPEYFAMLPDGTRGPDPTQDPGPEYIHMCVSEPSLTKQIIADWKDRGTPRFLNVCENDGWAGCACPTCLTWDEPDPDNAVPFDHRLAAAKRAFDGLEGRRDEWMLQMGSLSDRFARFWKNVAEEAGQVRRDVVVTSYVYDNYRKPPVKAVLSSNILCGVVPEESIFGYSRRDSATFRHDWSGWEKTGCRLFLRPNYTLQAPNFPAFYARTLGEDLKFGMAHGMKGTDFDSLTGKYSTQGPSLYVLAQILNHPKASVETLLDDFYAAFGSAKTTVEAYFALLESVYPNYSAAEQGERIRAKQKYGCGVYGPYYLLAGEIYGPETMRAAWSRLESARHAASSDEMASARIEWLAKGLKQTELMLAVQRAFEKEIDTGDKTDFQLTYQALKDFRSQSAQYDAAYFAGLTGEESRWEKAAR